MSIIDIRTALYSAYPNSPGWKNKVDKMPDGQVIAVYSRMNASGMLGRHTKENDSVQLSMFDKEAR